MSTRDIASSVIPQEAFAAVIATATTTNGFTVDTAHFDGGVMFFMIVAAYTGGTYQLVLQDSANGSSWSNIASNKLIAPDGSISFTAITTAGSEIKRMGAFSTRRYVRMVVISTSTPGIGAEVHGFCVKKSEQRPLAATLTP